MRPARPRRAPAGCRVGRRSLNPHVAALEELALPDRRDLLDPLDRVAARRVGVAAVRGARGDCDARLANLELADPVVQRQPRRRPPLGNLGGDALERLERERLVGLVLQISDASPEVVVAYEPQEGHHRAVGA